MLLRLHKTGCRSPRRSHRILRLGSPSLCLRNFLTILLRFCLPTFLGDKVGFVTLCSPFLSIYFVPVLSIIALYWTVRHPETTLSLSPCLFSPFPDILDLDLHAPGDSAISLSLHCVDNVFVSLSPSLERMVSLSLFLLCMWMVWRELCLCPVCLISKSPWSEEVMWPKSYLFWETLEDPLILLYVVHVFINIKGLQYTTSLKYFNIQGFLHIGGPPNSFSICFPFVQENDAIHDWFSSEDSTLSLWLYCREDNELHDRLLIGESLLDPPSMKHSVSKSKKLKFVH